jgi:CheY-like chemotaxis protein
MVLTMMGNEAGTAHDGVTGLKLAATYGPDVIFLDIGMPELNGYEVSSRIRQQEWGKSIVLIALTGWGQEDDKRRSLEAGFNIHLTKPILPAAIAKLLEAEFR